MLIVLGILPIRQVRRVNCTCSGGIFSRESPKTDWISSSSAYWDCCGTIPRASRNWEISLGDNFEMSNKNTLFVFFFLFPSASMGADTFSLLLELLELFLYRATQKVAGCYVIPSELWVSVCPSVCAVSLSVSTSFPFSNFSTFWPIFFKLCIDIGIGEEWYGIASGLISFWNNRVMALSMLYVKNVLRFVSVL